MSVSMEGGNPIRVFGDKQNPVTGGFLCRRGYADIERTYSEDRILYPHSRSEDGSFHRINWDTALSIITRKIQKAREQCGPESLLYIQCSGNEGVFTEYFPQRLFHALGCTHTDGSICSKSGHDALSLHYGLTYGCDPDLLPTMKTTFYWGFNAAVSSPHLFRLSQASQKQKGTVVAIDPRWSKTARAADRWIQVRPGGDVALAYGMMKHAIAEDLVDHAFIQDNTYGFEHLKNEVSRWSIDTIENYSGISWKSIQEITSLYAHGSPSVILMGIGMQKSLQGAEAVRAISLIPSVLGIHRGFFYTNYQGWNVDIAYLTGRSLTESEPPVISQVALGRQLEEGTFSVVYVQNMNPAETLPDSSRVRTGLEKAFLIVHDTHWTETTRLADIILPAPTYYEKEDVSLSYSHRYVRKAHKIIEPLGESKSEIWVISRLSQLLDRKENYLFEDPWKAVEQSFSGALEKGTFSNLMRGDMVTLKMHPREEYQTPTGKIEFYSTVAEKMGVDPLPAHHAKKPKGFILLNSATKQYTHTQFQDVHGNIPPIVFINMDDAQKIHIRDNDIVELSNERGSIKLKAVVSSSVPPGVLWSPRQCRDIEGTPQNTLIPSTTQIIGGGPIFNSTEVSMSKYTHL
jgi:anaerobic selenocysteine-containing dehydrogenase